MLPLVHQRCCVVKLHGDYLDTRIKNTPEELAAYDPELALRPQIVVATKIDALDEPERLEHLRKSAREDEKPFFAISSVTGAGVRELINEVAGELEKIREDSTKLRTRPADETWLVGSGARF